MQSSLLAKQAQNYTFIVGLSFVRTSPSTSCPDCPATHISKRSSVRQVSSWWLASWPGSRSKYLKVTLQFIWNCWWHSGLLYRSHSSICVGLSRIPRSLLKTLCSSLQRSPWRSPPFRWSRQTSFQEHSVGREQEPRSLCPDLLLSKWGHHSCEPLFPTLFPA